MGLYAYRREFLLKLADMPPSSLEKVEKLEQLRVLQAGYSILVGVVDEPTFGIDTPEDYRAFVEKKRRQAEPLTKQGSGQARDPRSVLECGDRSVPSRSEFRILPTRPIYRK